jgi:hypothetical protein
VLFIAVDDHAQIAYTELYPDELQENACHFLADAHVYYSSVGARRSYCLPKKVLPSAARALAVFAQPYTQAMLHTALSNAN